MGNGTYANTRWVTDAEALDGKSILEACVGRRLNICQPCATALTQEQNPELGFYRQAHGVRGDSEVKVVPVYTEGECVCVWGCSASQHGLGRYWKVTHSTSLASTSLCSLPSAGSLNLTAHT